jgi:hypothetical protein
MVCQWFSLKITGMVFSSLASKPMSTVFSGLVSKLVATVSSGLASKPVVGFLVEPQNQGGVGFPSLGLKITTTVSWFALQNHVGDDLLVAPQNQWEDVTSLDMRRDLAACFA